MGRYALTTAVLSCALLVSCFLRNVLVVWSIMGSTAIILMVFILPPIYWYQIVGPFSGVFQRHSAVALVALSVVLSIVCTVQTFMKLGSPPCPSLISTEML